MQIYADCVYRYIHALLSAYVCDMHIVLAIRRCVCVLPWHIADCYTLQEPGTSCIRDCRVTVFICSSLEFRKHRHM